MLHDPSMLEQGQRFCEEIPLAFVKRLAQISFHKQHTPSS
jgi:hypothetical protein